MTDRELLTLAVYCATIRYNAAIRYYRATRGRPEHIRAMTLLLDKIRNLGAARRFASADAKKRCIISH
jgi:hypothetical protein